VFDIFAPQQITPWRPAVLSKEQWPPDYSAVYAWRFRELEYLENEPLGLAAAKAYYARPENCKHFIMDWMDTYNPRKKRDKWVPFILFEKQSECIDFILSLIEDEESGLIEKCRDVGATWCLCAVSVWAWLFMKETSIGWGSRKQELVDRLGEPDSIFEKIRLLVNRLPSVFLPMGFNTATDLTFMKCLNRENGATISGESGDNIGRGGRKTFYCKDESAHYERPEKIEAALGDNTNVQIDISSVNGLGNVFHRKREAGVDWPDRSPGFTRVFVFDWSDHPEKTQEWYNQRRAKFEREGLLHIFAQEVERNYSAAVSNTIIPFEWITAARDAHLKFPAMLDGGRRGGFDIADEGGDTNALADIEGVVWRLSEEWGSRDPGVSARKAIGYFGQYPNVEVEYDEIGIGVNVKSEINRLEIDEKLKVPKFNGWNAGAAVQDPYFRIIRDDEQSPLQKDFFGNMKAQAWWALRTRFLYTYQAVTQDVQHDPATMISLDTANPLIRKLEKELAQPTMIRDKALRWIVDKKPEGTKSPNLADAGVMGYFPSNSGGNTPMIGRMGNG